MKVLAFASLLLLPATVFAAPAARVGDPTSHGGVVVAGSTNVFIGGLPAARVGSFATCPQSIPGQPPTPHVGGPIVSGAATVLVNGVPAARAGDPIQEAAAQASVVAAGAATVSIGSTPAQ